MHIQTKGNATCAEAVAMTTGETPQPPSASEAPQLTSV